MLLEVLKLGDWLEKLLQQLPNLDEPQQKLPVASAQADLPLLLSARLAAFWARLLRALVQLCVMGACPSHSACHIWRQQTEPHLQMCHQTIINYLLEG